MGRTIAGLGLALLIAGLAIMLAERFNIRLGRLPGDISWQGKNGSFYFPVVTCLLISAALTLIMWLFGRK